MSFSFHSLGMERRDFLKYVGLGAAAANFPSLATGCGVERQYSFEAPPPLPEDMDSMPSAYLAMIKASDPSNIRLPSNRAYRGPISDGHVYINNRSIRAFLESLPMGVDHRAISYFPPGFSMDGLEGDALEVVPFATALLDSLNPRGGYRAVVSDDPSSAAASDSVVSIDRAWIKHVAPYVSHRLFYLIGGHRGDPEYVREMLDLAQDHGAVVNGVLISLRHSDLSRNSEAVRNDVQPFNYHPESDEVLSILGHLEELARRQGRKSVFQFQSTGHNSYRFSDEIRETNRKFVSEQFGPDSSHPHVTPLMFGGDRRDLNDSRNYDDGVVDARFLIMTGDLIRGDDPRANGFKVIGSDLGPRGFPTAVALTRGETGSNPSVYDWLNESRGHLGSLGGESHGYAEKAAWENLDRFFGRF